MCGGEASRWVTADQLHEGRKAARPTDTWNTIDSRDAGYLAAAFDGEGFLSQRVPKYGVKVFRTGFAQKNNAMLNLVVKLLREAGFVTAGGKRPTKHGMHNINIGTRHEVLRLLGSIRPVRLLTKFNPNRIGAVIFRGVKLIAKIDAGMREVISIETDTKTFLVEGFARHQLDIGGV